MVETCSYTNNLVFSDEKMGFSLMLDTPYSKEVRLVFKKGQTLDRHLAPFPIVVQVLEGEIDFDVENKGVTVLKKWDCITLSEKIYHALLAKEDSVVRLSILKQNP